MYKYSEPKYSDRNIGIIADICSVYKRRWTKFLDALSEDRKWQYFNKEGQLTKRENIVPKEGRYMEGFLSDGTVK